MSTLPLSDSTGSTDEHDPFEVFDRAQGVGTVRDPYPMFAAFRQKAPVVEIDLRAMLGEGRELPAGMAPIIYAAVSHDAVAHVLRDAEAFSSSGYARTMGPVMGRTILEMDPPEHSRYRGLLQKAFSKQALERWDEELVGPVIHGLIDRFAERGSADLVRELTFPFPVAVICGMLGIPEEEHRAFHRLAVELISVGIDAERGAHASRGLGEMFARVLAQRRERPTGDLLSVLASAELDGTKLSDEEIFAFGRLLAPAGAETTYRSSSNLLFGLLSDRNQWEAVRADPTLIPQAIEEGLRWEAPLLSIMRTATRDVTVCGVRIPAGGMVNVNLGSANRDETRYSDPDRFDIHREAKQNMAFAFGPHRCLGMHLARLETTRLLHALFERLPNLRLDPAAEDVHITGMVFRSPRSLPVLFDPA